MNLCQAVNLFIFDTTVSLVIPLEIKLIVNIQRGNAEGGLDVQMQPELFIV